MKRRLIILTLLCFLLAIPFAACGDKTNASESSTSNVSEQSSEQTQHTVTLDKETVTLTVGETTTLTATVKPISSSGKMRMWRSSNGAVATVDGTGFVTAKTVGTAVITVVVDGVSKECVVIVVAAEE